VRVLLGLFVLAAAAALQTAGGSCLARLHLGADPLFVCSLCCAMLAGDAATLGVAAFAGVLKDLFSAGVFGHSVAAFIPLALAVSRMRRALWTAHWTTQAFIAFTGTLLLWAVYCLLSALQGDAAPQGGWAALVSAVVNACIAPLLFPVWRAIVG